MVLLDTFAHENVQMCPGCVYSTFEPIHKPNTGFHFSTVVVDINSCTVSHRIHLDPVFGLHAFFTHISHN